MTVASAITSALSTLGSDAVRSIQAEYILWDLREPRLLSRRRRERMAGIEAARLAIWNALLSGKKRVLIMHPESPVEYEVPGAWILEGDRTWVTPRGFDPSEPATRSWLSVGGWVAYTAPKAIRSWPDIFRITVPEACEWAARHAIEAAISSYLDDAEWRVVVGPGGAA
jgi:hypothetical protein